MNNPPSKLNTKVSLNKLTGLLEVYDIQTGKLVCVQSTPDEDLSTARKETLVERLLPNGETIICPANIDPALLMKFKYAEYNSYVVDLICEKIVEGGSLSKICDGRNGYPTYSQFCRWKRIDPDIQKRIDEARRDRAEYMRDEMAAMAKDLSTNIAEEAKIKIDTYKYLAGTDDKQKYGNQKSDAQVVQPIQIVVNTGIQRGENNG